MKPRIFHYLISLVLTLSLSLSSVASPLRQSADEANIRALIERYFAAYTREDLEAITGMWSAKSPDLAARKQALQSTFALQKNIEIKNLHIRRFTLEGEHADALVTLDVSAFDAPSNQPLLSLGKRSQNLSFVRETGEWKIWRDTLAEEELARRLLATPSEAQRQSLLAEDPELLTSTLPRAFYRIAERFRMQLDFESSMNAYRLMKQLADKIGDKYMQATALHVMGMLNVLQGNFDAGIECLKLSIQLREEIGRQDLLLIPLNTLSGVYAEQGNYRLALESAYQALAIAEAIQDRVMVGNFYLQLGKYYRMQFNLDLAFDYLKKGLAIYEPLGDPVNYAEGLEALSTTYAMAGDYPAAVETWQKAMKVMGNPTSGISAALMLYSLGNTHQTFGQYELALDAHLKALPVVEATGVQYTLTIVLESIAMDYYSLGNYEKALEYSARAAALARQMELLEPLSQILAYAGKSYQALGRIEEARQALDESIAANETMRSQVAGGAQQRQQFFEKKTLPYYSLIDLLARQNKSAEALAYAERAKGRVLLDVIQSGKTRITKTMTGEEREQEERLAAAIAALNTRIQVENARPQPSQTRLKELKTALEQARFAQTGFQAKLYTTHPELKVKRGAAQPLTLDQAGELLNDSKTALLEFAVADNQTFLFVLTGSETPKGRPEPLLRLYPLTIKRQELTERVRQLTQRIANNDLDYGASSGELYNLLLAPAAEQLRGKSRLVIIPDDVLWETPFQALRSPDGRFLIQSAAISYAPSLTVLREIAKAHKVKSAASLLAMGNPKLAGSTVLRSKNILMGTSFEPLPDAERLVKELAQVYGAKSSKVYVGSEAREERLKAEANRYHILQLATHGVINNTSPMYSHVVLAQGNEAKEDGLLEGWEMMQMDLQADLAVLSACETARGKIGAGEGVIGLSWALFVAGCPTTVVSQWKVESSSTRELMLEFHRQLKSGATKSEALRQAALQLMANKKFNHPFYWAGFIVIGDGN